MVKVSKKPRICFICGKTFLPKTNNSKCCSKECSTINNLAKMRSYSRMVRRENKPVGTVVLPKRSTNWDVEARNINKLKKATFSGSKNTVNTHLDTSNDALLDGIVDYESSTIMNDVDAFFS
jgi:hypothetical protein